MTSLAAAAGMARTSLLDSRNRHGLWEGQLASSSLATATACMALSLADWKTHAPALQKGLAWLDTQQNSDGGFGDTDRSRSNLSTSFLVWSLNGRLGRENPALGRYIEQLVDTTNPASMAEAVAARYGKDRTFSVPILMMGALGFRLGALPSAWKHVPALPFELAAVPRRLFAIVRMPVVSYALPALIAIGRARHVNAPSSSPFMRLLRRAVRERVLRLLTEIQPTSGGFLEAVPLTAFVTMALVAAGQADHPVAQRGIRFLAQSQREDGSWPIDTNLATWNTTLATKALDGRFPNTEQRQAVIDWLLNQQYHVRHPYTDAAPGGWAWTDLSGGVPDADDTPGALLALATLQKSGEEIPASRLRKSVEAGVRWLLDLQNGDGGIPTFCRGWGNLPFDRSAPDLTAHTLRAWAAWHDFLPSPLRRRVDAARKRALRYLAASQQPDGSWLPLWFGNQYRDDEQNPTYGTAMVTLALDARDPMAKRGWEWLRQNGNPDGGWGAGAGSPSSVEETALAVEALAREGASDALRRGTAWLIRSTDGGRRFRASAIGFYFARLWYFEELYPVIWTAGALRAAHAVLGDADLGNSMEAPCSATAAG